MEARKGGNGVRYDLPENGNDSGSSGSSASSYVSLLDGVRGGSRTKADAKRRTPPLWALAFLAFIPLVMFPLWSRLSPRRVHPPPEQGRGRELSGPQDTGPQQPEAPARTDHLPVKKRAPAIHSPFKHSKRVQELLAWVENATYSEGARPDWKDAAKKHVDQKAGFPNVSDVVPRDDVFEAVLFLRGRQVRLSALLFNLSEGWDGPAVAEELREQLLSELDAAVEEKYLGRFPSRTVSLKAGGSSTGVVLVTLTVTNVSPRSTPINISVQSTQSSSDVSSDGSVVMK